MGSLMKTVAFAASFAAITLMAVEPAIAGGNGVNSLINVAQIKAENANDSALEGADRQRQLLEEQRRQRERQRLMEEARQRQTTLTCPTCVTRQIAPRN